jgi:hypothetical protein
MPGWQDEGNYQRMKGEKGSHTHQLLPGSTKLLGRTLNLPVAHSPEAARGLVRGRHGCVGQSHPKKIHPSHTHISHVHA